MWWAYLLEAESGDVNSVCDKHYVFRLLSFKLRSGNIFKPSCHNLLLYRDFREQMFLRSSFHYIFFQTLCTCLWNICQRQLGLSFEFREAFQYIGEQQDPKRRVQKR